MTVPFAHRIAHCIASVLLPVALLTGCGFLSPPAPPQPVDPSRPESWKPADYVAPRGFATTTEMLQQLHSVAEGTVEDIHFDMDDCWGPRTVVTLGKTRSLIGAAVPARVELYTFGGPLPGGSYLEVSELPRFVLGARYLVFLRNTDWRYSPVMGDMAYRAERIAGKDVLVSTGGRAVTGLGADGIETDTAALTHSVGQRVKGLPAALREASSRLNATTPGVASRSCGRTEATGQGCRESEDPAQARRDADEARRHLVLTQRFARPELARDVNAPLVQAAIDATTLVEQVQKELARLKIKPGGRLFERPRYGCWTTTPTVDARSRNVQTLVR